ncbi:MAG TPA: hypothetical protein VGD94_05410 [Vicinamibacterales bacterium]
MTYEKPELILVDLAQELVLGEPEGILDNGVRFEHVPAEAVLGLDD